MLFVTLLSCSLQESKLYGAHFREIDANAPKATKIKFGDSDDEDWENQYQCCQFVIEL